MSALWAWLSRSLDLVLRSRRDRDLDEEVQSHLDLLTDDFERQGLSPAEARMAARRAFGGVDQIKERYRDRRGLPWLEAFRRDVAFGVRLLARDRAFTATAVLVLGIGIGVNNMLFTILNAHTIRGLPIDRADRVLYLSTIDSARRDGPVSAEELEGLQQATASSAVLAGFQSAPVSLGDEGRAPERTTAAFVTANTFDVLYTDLVAGSGFVSGDDRPGGPRQVLIGQRVWEGRYQRRDDLLGRSVLVDGEPAIVIGIVPERSGFPVDAGVFLPLHQAPGFDLAARTVRVIGRLHEGATIESARGQAETCFAGLRQDPGAERRPTVVPINDRFMGRLTDPAWLAFMTVGCLVLLISCANVGNLLLGRAVQRTREMAIRVSIGAGRSRLIRQLLTESIVLAAMGAGLGLALAAVGVRLFSAAVPAGMLPSWLDYSADDRVLAMLVAAAAGSVIVFGLVPALQLSRTDVNRALKDGGGCGRPATRRWTAAFLVAQVAFSVLMLANVALSERNARAELPTDHQLRHAPVTTMAITLPGERYATPERRGQFFRMLVEKLDGAGIERSAVAQTLPLAGASRHSYRTNAAPTEIGDAQVDVVAIGPGYFATLGIPLLAGREFSDADAGPVPRVAVVDEQFAAHAFPPGDVVGQHVKLSASGAETASEDFTVIGVAPLIRQRPERTAVRRSARDNATALVYVPYGWEAPATAHVLARSTLPASSVAAALRQALLDLDPVIPADRIGSLRTALADLEWPGRVSAVLIRVLCAIAVLLTLVGVYGVAAFGVSQRTAEIGVRMAIGASAGTIVLGVLSRMLRQVGAGVLVGAAAVFVWERLFATTATGADGAVARLSDPAALLVVSAVLAAMAAAACLGPAWRAAQMDPVRALRQE